MQCIAGLPVHLYSTDQSPFRDHRMSHYELLLGWQLVMPHVINRLENSPFLSSMCSQAYMKRAFMTVLSIQVLHHATRGLKSHVCIE